MAKYAHDISLDVRGKVGQHVYQRAKKGRGNIPTHGPYDLQLRAHVPQTDARTPAQLRVRARIAAATRAYKMLSATEREALRKQTKNQRQTAFNLFVHEFCASHPLSEY